jgi:outer membrane protein with beta-barrel domain
LSRRESATRGGSSHDRPLIRGTTIESNSAKSGKEAFVSHRVIAPVLVAAAAALLAAPAAAQSYTPRERMPARGASDVWAIANFVVPQESRAGNTAGFDGGFEYFFCGHVSAGAAIGFYRASLEGDHVNEAYLDAVAAHHFVVNRYVDPWIQGGIGAYRTDLGRVGTSATIKLGGFGGAGADFFLTRSFAVDVAARYHVAHGAEGVKGNFLELGGGIKWYF